MKSQTNRSVTSYTKTRITAGPGGRLWEKRRNRLRALLAVAAAAGTVLLAPVRANASAPEVNLIVNGGFETGSLAGWSSTGTLDGFVTSAEAHNGTYSMEMEAVDIIYQDFDPAARLRAKRLQFWAMLDREFAGPAYAIVYYHDGTSDSILFNSVTTTEWTEFSLPLHRKKIVVEVLIEIGESEPIYVDDVRLIQAP